MDYKGVIIEESLTSKEIINELVIVQTEVAHTTAKEQTPWLDKWTLQTVLIPDDKIEEYTSKLSSLIDTKHISNWYCDFRNDTYHYIVFYNKVFKLERNKKSDYEDMKTYALGLGIPEYQLPVYNDLPISTLMGFLVDAKRATYANSAAIKLPSSRVGSNDYQYEENVEGEVMTYHDTYFGGIRFIGEEVVYRESNKPKWGMNYYGITLDDKYSEEAMDMALRPALMMVGEDDTVLPVRGPSKYEAEGYVYTFKSDGDITNFNGVEEIHYEEKLIYRLICHGGLIE